MKNAIPTNVTSTISINSDDKKVRFLKKEDIFLYSAHSFIGDHTTVYNRCYLLSFCKTQVKTKKHDVVLIKKWRIVNLVNLELKFVCVIISIIKLRFKILVIFYLIKNHLK